MNTVDTKSDAGYVYLPDYDLFTSTDVETKAKYHTITPEQYEEFKYYYILDVLKGWRYGQSFCERFGISNASPLYHFKSQELCERWIQDNYLVKDETEVH